jgi:hypothetical protein
VTHLGIHDPGVTVCEIISTRSNPVRWLAMHWTILYKFNLASFCCGVYTPSPLFTPPLQVACAAIFGGFGLHLKSWDQLVLLLILQVKDDQGRGRSSVSRSFKLQEYVLELRILHVSSSHYLAHLPYVMTS